MRIIAITLLFTFASASNLPSSKPSQIDQGQTWKQIVVLKSTRSDMERLLGKANDQGYLVSYQLEEGRLDIEYYAGDHCKPGRDIGWDVPEWTVIELTYDPFERPIKLSSLNLDLERFRKGRESQDVPDLVTYINDEDGVAYTVEPDGLLNNVRYFPSSRNHNRQCAKHSIQR